MIVLDRNADTFPVGLTGTPFEGVYRALRIVAATVWDVDPLVYRAGMAWGWYALHDPAALTGFRDVVTAALISATAPMVKDTQTDAELVEYLRQWRSYTPTFPKLQAIYALFGAVVDIQPISDPESQAVLPVDDTRLAFYIRIESVDFSRPLSLAEAREIAVRATPLGSRPYPYYALETRIPCTVSPAPVGIYIRLENWETARPPVPPQQLGELIFVDASTGAVVYSAETLNEMAFAPTGHFTIEDDSEVLFVEESPYYPIVCQYSETHYGEVQANAGVTLALPYYTQKLYLYEVVAVGGNVTSGWEIVNDNGFVKVVNKTGAAVTAVVFIIRLIDATDASIVDVEYISTGFRASAFKWSGGGTDYYFIPFYEEETGWADDLSAIGWQEVPSVVLPTVSVIDDFGPYNWLYPQGASASVSITMQSNDVKNARLSDSNVPYDSGKSYGVVQWQNTPGVKDGAIELSIVNNSDYIALKNISSASITIRQAKVAVCSDSTATIITVYNANNVAYNAFKYTASGTDYYYVLDGVQADWTDDLSSLGYHLPTYGYPSEAGDTNDNVSVSTSGVHFLYNSQGSVITVPSGSTVSGTAYQRNGSPTLGFNGLYLYPGSTIVCMDLSTSYSFVSIWRVEYTAS